MTSTLRLLVPIASACVIAAAPALAAETAQAPAGTADTRYCMRIEAFTGSVVQRVKCWTREQWTAQGVDVDRDWAREGVRTLD